MHTADDGSSNNFTFCPSELIIDKIWNRPKDIYRRSYLGMCHREISLLLEPPRAIAKYLLPGKWFKYSLVIWVQCWNATGVRKYIVYFCQVKNNFNVACFQKILPIYIYIYIYALIFIYCVRYGAFVYWQRRGCCIAMMISIIIIIIKGVSVVSDMNGFISFYFQLLVTRPKKLNCPLSWPYLNCWFFFLKILKFSGHLFRAWRHTPTQFTPTSRPVSFSVWKCVCPGFF